MKSVMNRLQEYMEVLNINNHFNGTVHVSYKNEILLNKSYGLASYQYDIPNSSSTKYRIGSLTKAFTAAGILKLHEQEKLDINASVASYIPEYPQWSSVTLRHLLMNRSGITNFTSFPHYWTETMRLHFDLYQILDTIKDYELEFEPGEKMAYSNSGYLLLTAIIEKVTGLSFGKFLQETILDPLGLKNTGVDNGRTIVKHLATGHTVWEEAVHIDFIDMAFAQGAYGLYSTAEDLYQWATALQYDSFLRGDLQEEMFSGDSYGYGWFVSEQPYKKMSHFGDVNGFVSHIQLLPEREIKVIVLSNFNITPVEKISKDLVNIVLGQSVNTPVKIEGKRETTNLQDYIGVYEEASQKVQIEFQGKDLFTTIPKMYGVPYKFKLFPTKNPPEKDVFRSDFINDTYEFLRNPEGKISGLLLIDAFGNKTYLVKA